MLRGSSVKAIGQGAYPVAFDTKRSERVTAAIQFAELRDRRQQSQRLHEAVGLLTLGDGREYRAEEAGAVIDRGDRAARLGADAGLCLVVAGPHRPVQC